MSETTTDAPSAARPAFSFPTTIVIPLDGSEFAERALDIGEHLADRFGSRNLLAVTTPWDGDVEAARAYLDHVRDLRDGLRVEVIDGAEPAEAIVEAAAEAPGAMVCMTTHGRGRVGVVIIGIVINVVAGLTK